MKHSTNSPIPPPADRMGRFIGQMRNHERITLQQLVNGLCTLSYLGKIENGEREAGKLMVDAFFQRLGKPAERFERILDWTEFQQWKHRQKLIAHLRNGEIQQLQQAISITLLRNINEIRIVPSK